MTTVLISTLLLLWVADNSAQSSAFSVSECITRMTREVDRPYRLSPARAQSQCQTIQARIGELSTQIVGLWQRRSDDGHRESIEFKPDGTAYVSSYSYTSRRIEHTTENWTFVNPYSTPGSEVLDFYPYLVGVDFSNNSMEISHQPTSSQNAWADRWTRADRGTESATPAPSSNGLQEFLDTFRAAVARHDVAALRQMMAPDIYIMSETGRDAGIRALACCDGAVWGYLSGAAPLTARRAFDWSPTHLTASIEKRPWCSDCRYGIYLKFERRGTTWMWVEMSTPGD